MDGKKILIDDELENISGGRCTNKTEQEDHDRVKWQSSRLLDVNRYDPEYERLRKEFTEAYEKAEQKWHRAIWDSPDWGPNILFSDYFDPQQFLDDYYSNR